MWRFLEKLLQRVRAQPDADTLVIDGKTQSVLKQFIDDVARNPNDAVAYARMGQWWHWKGRWADALELLSRSIELDADYAFARCARADLLATCPDAAFRDGAAAIVDARAALDIAGRKGRLVDDWQHRRFLAVLAAAYAETGDFEAAMATERQALAYAITARAAGTIRAHLAKYETREPIHDPHGLFGRGPGNDGP